MNVLTQSLRGSEHLAQTSPPRPLTPAEIEYVAGGIVPLVAAIAGLIVAGIIERCGDDSEEEEQSDD